MKYEIIFTSKFDKDIKKAKKQGKDIDKLFAVIELLADGQTLDKKIL